MNLTDKRIINKSNLNFTIILLFGILLLLPLFSLEFIKITSGVLALILCVILLFKPDISLNMMLLFIFTGTLFSVNIGFTLKASQIFAVFALLGFSTTYFRGRNLFKDIPAINYFPFLFFILTIFPSLLKPSLFSDSFESSSALRYFFNYLLLQLMVFVVATGIRSKENLKNALILCMVSYLIITSFGIVQQIGYYSGIYNPYDYAGFHSTFVDFYGPFLRISPGTFANEFGEIIQSIAIGLTVFLIFMKKELSFNKKFLLLCILFITIISLIINFTRISWIIYLLFMVCIFFISKPKFNTGIKIISITAFAIGLIYYINYETGILNIIPIIDRFQEFADLTESSAGIRLNSWEEAYGLFLQNPFTGNGWGTCTETHNVPLELLAETGFLGFLGFYILVFWLMRKFILMYSFTQDAFLKTSSLTIILVFSGCLIFDLTNHGIFHFVFWLTIGLGLSIEKLITLGQK